MSNFLVNQGNQGSTFTNHGSGGGTTFTLPSNSTTNSVLLTVGAVLQQPGTDYTVSGSTISTSSSVSAGIEVCSWILHRQGTAPTIQDNSVTGGKIALTSQAEGDLMYCNASGDWVRLAKGTAGQVLKQNSGLTAPEWGDAGGGSAFLGSTDLSSDATYDFTATDNSSYDAYLIVFANVSPATDARYFRMRTSTDGGSTYDNAAGSYEWRVYRYGPGISSDVATTTEIDIIGDYANPDGQVGNAAGEEGLSGHMWVHGAHLAKHTQFDWHVTYATASNELQGVVGVARRKSSADVDAWRFLFDSGNLASGTITTFGFKNA